MKRFFRSAVAGAFAFYAPLAAAADELSDHLEMGAGVMASGSCDKEESKWRKGWKADIQARDRRSDAPWEYYYYNKKEERIVVPLKETYKKVNTLATNSKDSGQVDTTRGYRFTDGTTTFICRVTINRQKRDKGQEQNIRFKAASCELDPNNKTNDPSTPAPVCSHTYYSQDNRIRVKFSFE